MSDQETSSQEPTEPGWYTYSGGAQVMIFHLRRGGQWSAHFDDGSAADCVWSYIEQALSVWDLVPLEPQLPAADHGEGCSCTELCSMGPTCPGGMLAGLTGSGCWRSEDEAGMPKHLPMGVTEDGHGPAEPDAPHHFVCWCADPECAWTKALATAREKGAAAGWDEGYMKANDDYEVFANGGVPPSDPLAANPYRPEAPR